MRKHPIKGLGDVGYVPDQEGYELQPQGITDLNNMRVRNGWLERVRGYRQVSTDLSFVPYGLTGYAANETKYLIEMGLQAVNVDDGTTRTVITPATYPTMNYGHKWTGDFLAGYQIFNNQADAPWSWDGSLSSVMVALANWTSTHRAKSIRALERHLVALNITKGSTNYPHRIKISGAAEPGSLPGSWDETDATEDTDEFDVLGDGVLVDGILMGDAMILYKERSVASLRYSPNITSAWVADPLPFKLGMMTQNCGVSVPGVGHVVLTKGDVVRFDGNSVVSIIEGRAREWLFDNIDTVYWYNSFVLLNERKSEVWVCFPATGQQACTKALVWNYGNDKVTRRDIPACYCGCAAVLAYASETYDDDSVTFNSESTLTFNTVTNETIAINDTRLFLGSAASEVFLMDSGDQADGAAFEAYVERTGLDDIGGLAGRVKRMNRLHLNIDADAGTQISVSFGASMDAKTAPTYKSAVTFTVGTDQYVSSRATGKFLAWKLSATGSAFWRVRTVTPEVVDAGYR